MIIVVHWLVFFFSMKYLDLIKHYAKCNEIFSSLKWNHNAGNSKRFSYRFFNRSIAFWRLYVIICDEKQYQNSDFSNYCFSIIWRFNTYHTYECVKFYIAPLQSLSVLLFELLIIKKSSQTKFSTYTG